MRRMITSVSVLSALWRHQHGRAMFGGMFGGCLILGVAVNAWLAYGLWVLWLSLVAWESVARLLAKRRGFSVLYVLPTPSGWAQKRLRDLGYPGKVASYLWEMHVNETVRWRKPEESSAEAAQRFRAAYTADRLRWLQERPPNVGLLITTFNRLPEVEQQALQEAGAWIHHGPLTASLPALASPARMGKTQRRMFGAVVSHRDRTRPESWTTVYVPPQRAPVTETVALAGPPI